MTQKVVRHRYELFDKIAVLTVWFADGTTMVVRVTDTVTIVQEKK